MKNENIVDIIDYRHHQIINQDVEITMSDELQNAIQNLINRLRESDAA